MATPNQKIIGTHSHNNSRGGAAKAGRKASGGVVGHKKGMVQTGIVRTNCVDCLDRTNTAQVRSDTVQSTLTCWIEATVLIVATGGDFYSNNDVIIPKNGKQIKIFQQKPSIIICLNDFGTIPLPYN